MAGSIGNASLYLSTNANGFNKGLDGAANRLRQFSNEANNVGRGGFNMQAITSGIGKINSSLQSVNFSQFLVKSMDKGGAAWNAVDWTAVGGGLGLLIGGPLGATIGTIVGASVDSVFARAKALRESLQALQPLSNITGFSAVDLHALQGMSGMESLDRVMQKFNQARSQAILGDSQMQRAFQTLGLRPEAITSVDQLVAAFGRLDRVTRNYLGTQIFGERGGAMIAAALSVGSAGQELEQRRQIAGNASGMLGRGAMRRQAIADAAQAASESSNWFSSFFLGNETLMRAASAMGLDQGIVDRRMEQIERNRRELAAASRSDPEADRDSGHRVQADNMIDALEKQNALLHEQRRIGRGLTEQETTLFQLRRQGASEATLGPATAEAEHNRLLARAVGLSGQYENGLARINRELRDMIDMGRRGLLNRQTFEAATAGLLGAGDLRNPIDTLRESVARANAAFQAGGINANQYRLAVNRAGQAFLGSAGNQQTRFAGAMQAGSREAVDLMQRHRFEGGPQVNVAAILQQQTRIQENQYRVLQDIARQGGITLATLP